MNIHELKTWPDTFQAVRDGIKTFEVRKDDRGYKVGDILHLKEWDKDHFTGRYLFRCVIYIINLDRLLSNAEAYVVMSITKDGVKDALADVNIDFIEEKTRG